MRPLLEGHIPGPVSYPLGRAFPTSVTHPNVSLGTVQSTLVRSTQGRQTPGPPLALVAFTVTVLVTKRTSCTGINDFIETTTSEEQCSQPD